MTMVNGAAATLQAKGLAPSLTVNDMRKSLHFYTEGLGFGIEDQNEENGQVRFAMLRAGDGRLGIGQDDFAKGRDRVKGVGLRMWISTTQDLNALAGRIKAAGYQLDSEPAALPWGPLAFAVTDPDGFKFTIASDV